MWRGEGEDGTEDLSCEEDHALAPSSDGSMALARERQMSCPCNSGAGHIPRLRFYAAVFCFHAQATCRKIGLGLFWELLLQF